MERNDSTGRDLLQDAGLSDSYLVSAATKARQYSRDFGWPLLLLFAVGPLNPTDFHDSLQMFFWLGFPSLALGLFLRLWAKGYKREEGFVTDGPYRHVRNPVELGALLAYLGAGIILGLQWWYNLLAALIAWVYLTYVSLAFEQMLYLEYGPQYLRYSQRVRRWLPSPVPVTNRSGGVYSLRQALRFELRDTVLWSLGYAVVYAIRRRVSY